MIPCDYPADILRRLISEQEKVVTPDCRAGLHFPELPYGDLLESEGFGKMCTDFGITPIGLPQLGVLHVNW